MSIATQAQVKDMFMNVPPVEVPANETSQTNVATEGYNVITITPNGNYSVQAQLLYGSDSKTQNVPAGSPVVYPIVQQFGNNVIQVNNLNTQQDTALLSGWYALSTSPNEKLVNTPTTVKQYQSIGAQTTSSIQTLTLEARSTAATLAILIIGGNKPVPVFLNTNKGNLPPAWQNLDNAVFETGNTYQMSQNFFGQTMFIVNVSLTKGATFDARIQ
ncbi:hypothetical protein POV27_14145 [Aureisphaera galaxeae]|uniref:hypothetical protein n=1 Tax=Aureisphaera galaxeae TaxID=1538023 RepID=UPI002350CAA1|nr:hypothetical protein [Aureisphaera galaxeae]MDC8005198.1 hypothetical protein [Aureisphaera galaxeae]